MRAWQQFLQIMACVRCGWSKGRRWVKDDVIVTVDPCEKHARLLAREWTDFPQC